MAAPTLRTAHDLEAAGLIAPGATEGVATVGRRYAVAVTPDIARLVDLANPDDPIRLQFVPDPRELTSRPEERADPIGDDAHSPCEGVVHRYPDRVLLKLVQACAVYCRFCFRRESVGAGHATALTDAALETALGYIAAHPEIWEVILTGGDPLVLAPRRLAAVAARLATIAHVKILRVHTRLPIAAPDRVTDALIDALRRAEKTIYVAIHANHPRELTGPAHAAIGRLRHAGFSLVSQTVLLRGVNDDAEILAALMRAFVEAQVTPYYLHHPDLAPGTGHFRLSIAEGQALVRRLRGRLSGLCQPQYVLDIPGGHGKSPLTPNYLHEGASGSYAVEDYRGFRHAYPPPR